MFIIIKTNELVLQKITEHDMYHIIYSITVHVRSLYVLAVPDTGGEVLLKEAG